MAVNTVSKGQPITATWANALVSEVNKLQPLPAINTTNKNLQMGSCMVGVAYSEAWHMEWSGTGKLTLNAGQIYLNGKLIKPSESCHSYNQFSSVSNYGEFEAITVKDEVPILCVEIEIPKDYTDDKISQVKAKIVKQESDKTENNNNGDGEEEEPTTDKVLIQLNDRTADKKDFIQLVSGSIYISTGAATLPKAKEGIIITDDPVEEEDETQTQATAEGENEEEKKTEKVIKLHVSIIGEDGIEVLDELYNKSHKQEENPDGEKEENPARIFVIRGKRISFIGEDGITIDETKEMISEDEGGTLETPKEQTIYTIRGQAFSIIGEDGIFVHEEKVLSGDKELSQFTIYGKKVSLIAKDEMKMKIDFQTGEDNSVASDGTVIKAKWDYWTLQPKGISIIAGDGISIIHTDDLDNFIDCYEIVATASNISFVGCDKIRITEREGVDNTQKRKEIYVINDHFSLIPTDNLRIEKENGECTYSSPPLSLKRNWETNKIKSKFVTLKEGSNVHLDKKEIDTTTKWEDEYTINVKNFSVIAGDGVNVEVSEDGHSKCYTVSVGSIPSQIEFDPIYFIVEDGTVSLNEDALNQIVNEALEELSVEVTANGVVEHTARGTVTFNTPTQNLTLRSDTEFYT